MKPVTAQGFVRFDGTDYVPSLDDVRLTGQTQRVFNLMTDGRWRTLAVKPSEPGMSGKHRWRGLSVGQ